MTSPTPEELADLYRSMTNEQLLATAMGYDTLTDSAQSAIRSEFAHRKMEPPELPDTPAKPEFQRMIIVGRYRDLPQAQMARSALESAGIPCFLRDENTVRNDWFLSNLMGGMRLMVKESDRATAEEILGQSFEAME